MTRRLRRYAVARERHSRAYPWELIDLRTAEVLARLSERWIAEAIRDLLEQAPADRPDDDEDQEVDE